MFFLRAVKWWIVLSTLASVAGWTLSALGLLNETGYLIFAGVVVVLAWLFRKSSPLTALFPLSPVQSLKILPRRFRRFLPVSFAILAALVFLSGVLYAPNDHTGLSYRVARVLQWLQHGRWVWIHTPNYRMNDRACGIEWLSAPLLLFLKSDRALFLLNFIPFLLMPGLIFSVWTRLGVRSRVAWNWMWLVPTGYCFLIQAGGIGNDAFPTVYALAMMDFALRAREKLEKAQPSKADPSRRSAAKADGLWTADLGFSLLSAALLVGAKASNLPLGLPWAIVFFPLLPHLWSKTGSVLPSRNPPDVPRASSAFNVRRSMFDVLLWSFLLFIAVLVSFVPTALLNIHYLHDWSGLTIEHKGMAMKNPIAGLLGNAVLLVTNNFVPTFFPLAHWWNEHALSHFPGWLARLMNANFEEGFNSLGELPTEDATALGFGVSVLVLVSIVAAFWLKRTAGEEKRKAKSEKREKSRFPLFAFRFPLSPRPFSQLALIAPWISLLAYCVNTGMVSPGRLIAPYYPLLFPLLLIGAAQAQVVRRRWWNVLAGAVLALAFVALIVNPSRPLWPAKTILAKAVARRPNQPQLLRAQKVYEVYGHRSDPLAGIRQWFPPGLKVIGFMGTDDDLDISLWKPYGSRRVEPFLFEDSPEKIRELGFEYAVVSGLNLEVKHATIDEWLQKSRAELIATTIATMTVSQGPEQWYLVRLKP